MRLKEYINNEENSVFFNALFYFLQQCINFAARSIDRKIFPYYYKCKNMEKRKPKVKL